MAYHCCFSRNTSMLGSISAVDTYIRNIISYHVMSCHVMSSHVMSCHGMSYHVFIYIYVQLYIIYVYTVYIYTYIIYTHPLHNERTSKHIKPFIWGLFRHVDRPTSPTTFWIFWPGGRKPRHCKFQVTNTCGKDWTVGPHGSFISNAVDVISSHSLLVKSYT